MSAAQPKDSQTLMALTPTSITSMTSMTPKSTDSGERMRKYRPATECVHVEATGVRDVYNASSVPIYQTATFRQTGASEMGEYDYTRSGNPTRTHLESHLAKLMHAQSALAVSSGMGALDTITRLVKAGEEIIAGDDIYGETPTNPLIKIANIPEIAKLVHDTCPNALVVVDNTMMSPYLQKPLDLGADITYHSATKYLSGHHDLMAGVVGVKDPALAESLYMIVNATGCGLAPFDSFLLMRGIKTLSVRMDRQQASAMYIADYLESKGFVVRYPGLKSHPQYELHRSMAKGAGAVLSFQTGCVNKSSKVVESTQIWGISVSFGCVNSLISMPCRMSHASIPAAVRKERSLPEDLIRLCVGIEDVNDLQEDLEAALIAAGCI
ncbi:hypothetical protein BSLG_000206 [Batrachochytrium salamandrivorans]|nr:hypothetical protein BSLG_000206 [Batrachochytrium salamandrivorans]